MVGVRVEVEVKVELEIGVQGRGREVHHTISVDRILKQHSLLFVLFQMLCVLKLLNGTCDFFEILMLY